MRTEKLEIDILENMKPGKLKRKTDRGKPIE